MGSGATATAGCGAEPREGKFELFVGEFSDFQLRLQCGSRRESGRGGLQHHGLQGGLSTASAIWVGVRHARHDVTIVTPWLNNNNKLSTI